MKSIAEIFNIKYPIIQGGMTKIADSKLVSAVANAGGLGILASAGMSATELKEEIRRTKNLTDKPFGVNLMLMNKNIPELIDVIIEEGIKIVSTGAGTPKPYMQILKKNNIKVIAVIPNVKVAKKMEEIGVDVVVAEGTESGGHVGETTTLSLVPQVVDAVNIPVIAAGGIADGRGVAASFVLGAKGVQCGTIFLTAEECSVGENFKQAIVNATDTSTTVASRQNGIPFRSIKNELVADYISQEINGAEREQLDKIKMTALNKSIIEDDAENGIVMAGQIAGLIKETKPVKQIIEEMFAGYNELVSLLKKI